jgi:hypothetical protein
MRLALPPSLLALALLALTAGCERAREETPPAADATTPAEALQPTPTTPLMAEMQAHLRALEGAAPESVRAALPAHREKVDTMLARMERDARGVSAPVDETWGATVDSLRRDLERMPGLSPAELRAFLPSHGVRIERLLVMHRDLLGRR